MEDIDVIQKMVRRIYIGRIICNRIFVRQIRRRRYLESYQCITGEVCEECGCICVCKTNGKREDCKTKFYRARLKNH